MCWKRKIIYIFGFKRAFQIIATIVHQSIWLVDVLRKFKTAVLNRRQWKTNEIPPHQFCSSHCISIAIHETSTQNIRSYRCHQLWSASSSVSFQFLTDCSLVGKFASRLIHWWWMNVSEIFSQVSKFTIKHLRQTIELLKPKQTCFDLLSIIRFNFFYRIWRNFHQIYEQKLDLLEWAEIFDLCRNCFDRLWQFQ